MNINDKIKMITIGIPIFMNESSMCSRQGCQLALMIKLRNMINYLNIGYELLLGVLTNIV